jgi:hypothetical protein
MSGGSGWEGGRRMGGVSSHQAAVTTQRRRASIASCSTRMKEFVRQVGALIIGERTVVILPSVNFMISE